MTTNPAPVAAVQPARPRLHMLDVLRGIAALAVVIYHWRHFAEAGGKGSAWQETDMPLPVLLGPIYRHGQLAVDLFFCLSGFVFFWIYADAIRERAISAAKFAVLRFSRLYPLHLATLLFVAAGQWIVTSRNGHPFVYLHNDVTHFVRHLAFASNWWSFGDLTFNGPVWSVSMEVAIYAVFFVACFCGLRRGLHVAMVAVAAYALGHALTSDLLLRAFQFFAGGATFVLYEKSVRRGLKPSPLVIVPIIAVCWAVVPWLVNENMLYSSWTHIVGSHRFIGGRDPVGAVLLILTPDLYGMLLFPVTILAVALLQERWGERVGFLSALGEISYSSYLIHFPLQLLCVLLAMAFGAPTSWFNSLWFMAAFFAVLIPASLWSYRYFEVPVQRAIRSRFLQRNR